MAQKLRTVAAFAEDLTCVPFVLTWHTNRLAHSHHNSSSTTPLLPTVGTKPMWETLSQMLTYTQNRIFQKKTLLFWWLREHNGRELLLNLEKQKWPNAKNLDAWQDIEWAGSIPISQRWLGCVDHMSFNTFKFVPGEVQTHYTLEPNHALENSVVLRIYLNV